MTLIATTTNYSFPIILSDLLTTSDERKENFSLPTFQSSVGPYLPHSSQIFPHGLIQKAYIIKKELVILIAGDFDENKEIIKLIRKYFENVKCTTHLISRFIKIHEHRFGLNSAYLICFYEKKEKGFLISPVLIGKNWKEYKSKLFENVIANGSGANYYLQECRKFSEIFELGEKDYKKKALAVNLIMLGHLIAIENSTLETIKKNWGGGFEIISFDDQTESFYKVNEFTIITWRGDLDLENKKLEMVPSLVLSTKYHEDLLIISAVQGDKYEKYGVLPIDKDKESVVIEDLPKEFFIFNKFICNTFILRLSNGNMVMPSILIEKEKDEHGEIFIELPEDGRLSVGISQRLTDFLISEISSREGNNQDFNIIF